jgi:hypothetical protein
MIISFIFEVLSKGFLLVGTGFLGDGDEGSIDNTLFERMKSWLKILPDDY